MYVLGIDFGGGACKATLLSDCGEITATHTEEYPTSYPQSGFVEQNPLDWYQSVLKTISLLIEKNNIVSKEIVAIALDAATHTAVLTDENFNILRPAIYWTDTRSVTESQWLTEYYGTLIDNQVLHRADTIWTLPQLLWIRKHEPDIWTKTRRILFAKDFIRHQLTDDYVTDFIEAEGSMLFDYNTLQWSEELCNILGFGTDQLPTLVHPISIAGGVTRRAAEKTGLHEGTPVLCGTTDTAMEVFAAGAITPGQMTVKLATAGRICVVTKKSYPDTNLINYSHVVDGLWYSGTATKSCAASYRWYRDVFGNDYSQLDNEAKMIEIGSQGLMFHPYLNGELTPHADPLLCGSFVGIRAGHVKAHFTRAVLEGVALSLLDCKSVMETLQIDHDSVATIIGGGAKSSLWRRILADTLGMTLIQKENSDSSFGSAMLAGIAIGFFKDFSESVHLCTRERSRTEPITNHTEQYKILYEKYKLIHQSLAPIYHNEIL
ncbi:MAG: hypothetical protein LBI18_09210 [Planctomycetaceae bacterium]|jgi:xylulokinase|nr:hypothetical protein [Planctomycetaceae bacterium]